MAQGDITDNVIKTNRHTSFYLAAGPELGTPIIFLHGWPELSISWRHQLPAVREPRLSRHCARHARLRSLERLRQAG